MPTRPTLSSFPRAGGVASDLLLSCGDGEASLAIWRVEPGNRAAVAATAATAAHPRGSPFSAAPVAVSAATAAGPAAAVGPVGAAAASSDAACVCWVRRAEAVVYFASCARPAALEAAELVSAAEARQGAHVVAVAAARETSAAPGARELQARARAARFEPRARAPAPCRSPVGAPASTRRSCGALSN